jgi:lipopolysaccharide/colanic/teichoic acid biosynthesis glycosyltransferase
MKRLLDVVTVLLFLPFFLPIAFLTALLVLIFLGRPVFFTQKRAGRNGKIFNLVKFRTMKNGIGNDSERLTRFGCFLRSTSLDEIPQLWNVLKGDMSLVGPRPLPVEYLPRYSSFQMRRHEVLPGITGWAQVHGRNQLDWEDKFRYDVEYVDNITFKGDVKILVQTVMTVLQGKGISSETSATMEEFMGTVEDAVK